MFELNHRYTFTLPAGTISETGIAKIKRAIMAARPRDSDDWKAINPNPGMFLPDLPESWAWVWLVEGKADYVGTFPKRVAKFYYKRYGLKVPPSFLSELGNLARQHSDDKETYEFEIVDKIDWSAGDFGDNGSCYWGSNSGAREILTDNSALAIRFYDDGSGCARAWVVIVDDNLVIVFNGQGYSTLHIARIFGTFINRPYKKIYLCNHRRTDGLLWIDGNSGFALADYEHLADLERFDLEFGDDWYTGCYDCGRYLHDDDIHWAHDEPYCESCFYERFSYCAHCDEPYHREEMVYVRNMGDVCDYCFGQHYGTCENCGESMAAQDLTLVGDEYLCDKCKPEPESE